MTTLDVAKIRRHAEAAEQETDARQPDDRDMLSPKAAKISEMHALLTPDVVLSLLDAFHEARMAYLKLHQHDLQIACNEREALRARVKELEEDRRPAHARLARENFPGLADLKENT